MNPTLPTRSKKTCNTNEDDEAILKSVASLPIREDQAGMTPEQRKVINEIMDKVFEIMKQEGRTIRDSNPKWTTRKQQP